MKILCVTQARVGSTRFYGKILKKINSKTLLEIHLKRISKSKFIDKIIVATSVNPDDKKIHKICKNLSYNFFAGSENDVLDRIYKASLKYKEYKYIVRLTSDCPLIDPILIDKVIKYCLANKLDYCSNTLNPTYPDGQDIEIFTLNALKKAWKNAKMPSEREHVTPYIWKNSTYNKKNMFKSENFDEGFDYSNIRMTVDELNDYILVKKIVENLNYESGWLDYVFFILNNPELKNINKFINRNEGYTKSLNNEKDR